MERELRRKDTVDRYWDSVARGENPSRPPEVDTLSAAIIAKLSESDVTGDTEAIHQRLRSQISLEARKMEDSMLTVPLPQPAMRIPESRQSPNVEFGLRSRPVILLLAIAASLLLAFGLGYFTLGPGRPDSEQPRAIPAAVVQDASPSPEASTVETLFETTLPAESLPRGDDMIGGAFRASIPAGNTSSWLPYCCPGPITEFVLAGSYTVRADEQVQVVRADGSIVDIPANTEATLGPGDTLISRNEIGVETSNSGSEPVELLSWGLFDDGNQFRGHTLSGWIPGPPDIVEPVLLPGPANIRLLQVTLPPDSEYSLTPPGTHTLIFFPLPAAAGTPEPAFTVERTTDGLINTGDEEMTVYVMTLEQPEAGTPEAGTPTGQQFR